MNAIVFDLDGTLLAPSGPYRDIVADAFVETAGTVRDEWLDAYESAFFEAFDALERAPVRRAVGRIDDGPEPDAFARALLEAEIEAFEPAPSARSIIESLACDNLLAVCTNGVGAWQREKLRAHELLDPFDAVITSYEAGAHKPDPRPFRAVEAELGADRYGMIGDADADVDGARNVGWDAIRYDGGEFPPFRSAFGWVQTGR
ncbi:HAD family hydrolase [Halovivax gelatinilyticus]|uniref:HAD family hydrolase n=1 Tax=Halovivax gelatinilyticus TaxID=2961597 RepID=UPI0020CA7EC1|nr:HAD family hydrolase [Halovivax gelatinilyticus]